MFGLIFKSKFFRYIADYYCLMNDNKMVTHELCIFLH